MVGNKGRENFSQFFGVCSDEGADLEQPLLNGDAENDGEGVKTQTALPKPPGAPSTDFASTGPEEAPSAPGEEKRSWKQWFKSSPVVPTSCCIFLCFILKVVQQVCFPRHTVHA